MLAPLTSPAVTDRAEATAAIQQGQFDRAEAALRRVVEQEPRDALSLHDLGVALARQRKLDDAIAVFQRALDVKPGSVDTRRNLGVALAQRGRKQEAANAFQNAVELDPTSHQCRRDWATALKALGKLDEAVSQFREAIRLMEEVSPRNPKSKIENPKSLAEAYHDLGLALAERKRGKEAEDSYRRALAIKTDFPEALNNLGILLEGLGRLSEAEAAYRAALAIKPKAADVHNNLGVALAAQRKYEEAVGSYRESLRLSPDAPLALNNLGNSLRAVGQIDEAVSCLRRAIRLKPDYAEAYNNLGIALVQWGQDEEAVRNYERALYFRPDYPEAHLNRSLAWLANGEFDRGWTEYEWRWMAKDVNRRGFRQRRWDGCDLHGRSIFVYLEQGLGDTLQFVRYARLLKQRGARVIVEAQKSLVRLLGSCPFIDQVVPHGGPLPEFDLQVPLLSLPGLFRTLPDTVPDEVPYLLADEELVEHWRQRLGGVRRQAFLGGVRRQASGVGNDAPDAQRLTPNAVPNAFLIGIAWQGNKQYRGDRQRSIPLRHFQALADVPGVRLISLQKGLGSEQVAEVVDQFAVAELGAIDETAGAFMDTAAIMKCVDLVITSDTALPHLAGALGVPVWMALPAIADWRWLRSGERSPWYPTMRLFRQSESESWDEVFDRIAEELLRFTGRLCRVGQDCGAIAGPPSYIDDHGDSALASSLDPPYGNPKSKIEISKSYDVLTHAIPTNGAKQSEHSSNAINLTCPINQLGYGVVGLNVLKALKRAGKEVACWPIGRIDAAADDCNLIEEAVERQQRFDGHAPSIRIAHQNHLAEHVGLPRIGFPIFELDRFTEQELNHLRNQDRLLVTCQWAKEVVEACGAMPAGGAVDVVPLGVDREIFHGPRDGNGEHRSSTTVFLSVGKWERRKGHDILLEAFNKAFGPRDDVELWMLTFNPVIGNDRSATVAKNQQWETLYKSCPLAEKIRVLPRLADQREVAATMRQADCGVFLSRAEGWNLPLLEMMSCGRQVIATNYSAHTEYCDSSNSLFIDIDKLEDAYDDRWFSGQGRWAMFGAKQLDQAIAHLRQIHSQKQAGRPLVNRPGIETARRFTWENTASRIVQIV